MAINIIISEDGSVRVDVDGIVGSSCTDITGKLEQALGEVTNRDKKNEFYEAPNINKNRIGNDAR
jgi:hypothetical protein